MKKLLCCGFVIVMVVLLSVCFWACSSTPDVQPLPAAEETEPASLDTPVVSLFVPESVDRSYFSFPDATIMADLQIGSPESLRRAVANILKTSTSYTQSDKVALTVAYEIMNMVWKSERNTIEIPSGDLEANPYTGAIESARIGIYDLNTGNSDFFTLVLPSLVLVLDRNDSEYYALSLDALNKALQLCPESVLVRYLLGLLYTKLGDLQNAFDMFKVAAENAPTCFELRYACANNLFLQGMYSQAMAEVLQLLATSPRNLTLLKLCTEISLARKDYLSAEQYIAQVLQQEPENSQYLLYRIQVLVEQGNFIKAVPLLDVYSRTDQSSKGYLILRSRVQHEWNKNSVAAAATLEEALMLYPEDFEIILAAAELAASSGGVVRGKTAGQLAQEILERDSSNSKALKICVDDAIRQKQWQRAYDYSSSLMKNGVSTLDLQLSHISICVNLNRISEAKVLAQKLNSDYPDSDEVTEAYIRVLAADGQKSTVLDMIQRLLPKASSKLKSFLYYQRSIFAASDSEKLADLRQSLTANPRNQSPLFELYQYYYDKQDYRKAQYYLKQVVALNPSDQEMLQLNAELDALLSR
ncbi:MAG: tetratricopeptide repeat protein [Spirochaetaceae bacterium]|nr:tetratricopeptide repeat protein [Spirochaetaceae bacterium]